MCLGRTVGWIVVIGLVVGIFMSEFAVLGDQELATQNSIFTKHIVSHHVNTVLFIAIFTDLSSPLLIG